MKLESIHKEILVMAGNIAVANAGAFQFSRGNFVHLDGRSTRLHLFAAIFDVGLKEFVPWERVNAAKLRAIQTVAIVSDSI